MPGRTKKSRQVLTKSWSPRVVSTVTPSKHRSQQQLPPKKEQLPQVGIIFVLGDRVLIESVASAEGEVYGDCINYPTGHEQFWARLQAAGRVQLDEEYIGVPRGRVLLHKQSSQYSLLLDRCILQKPKIVREIQRRMNLPTRSLHVGTDDHYRCSFCLREEDD